MANRQRGPGLEMIAACALAAAATLCAGPMAAQTSPHVMTQPDWVRKPDAAALSRNYPGRAYDEGVEGRATIHCEVTADGALEACRVTSEAPAGYGFGQAAVRMAKDFRFRPAALDGAPVGGAQVNIPIRFVLPEGYRRPMRWPRPEAPNLATLELLAAIAGLALALAGVAGLLAGTLRPAPSADASIVETPRHSIWPWALLGGGLAAVAAVTPSLLGHGAASWRRAISGPGGAYEILVGVFILCALGAAALQLTMRARLAGLRNTGSLPPGFNPWVSGLRLRFIWGGGHVQIGDGAVSRMVLAIRILNIVGLAAFGLIWLLSSGSLAALTRH